MSCEDYRELLVSQLCGGNEEEQETALEQHLEICLECKKAQTEFRAMLGLMRQLPERDWDEKLRIRDLLRRNQRWRAIVFSKAALWMIGLIALIFVISYLPVRWELTPQQFSIRWGSKATQEEDFSRQLRELRAQLAGFEKENRSLNRVSEMRIKQILNKNNADEQKRYWETLQMFSNYLQVQRNADLQKIRRDIATTYDRTGQEVEKTNELLEYVLRTSSPTDTSYDAN